MESEWNQHWLTDCRWLGGRRGVSPLGSPSATAIDVLVCFSSLVRPPEEMRFAYNTLSGAVNAFLCGLGWVHVVDGKVLFDPS